MDETVLDMDLAEKLIHKKLSSSRINPKREFFQMPLKDAVRTALEICRDVDERLLNISQTTLAIFVSNRGNNKISAKELKLALQNHLGGSAMVRFIFTSDDGGAKCEMALSEEWKVVYSPRLFNDLKNVVGVSDLLYVTSSTENADDEYARNSDSFVDF